MVSDKDFVVASALKDKDFGAYTDAERVVLSHGWDRARAGLLGAETACLAPAVILDAGSRR